MKTNKFFEQIKRISMISLSLTVILSTFVFAAPVSATGNIEIWNGSDLDADFAGSGTKDDPYQINSAAELYGFAKKYCGEGPIASEGKYFELNTDIYLNDISNSNWMNKSNKPHEWAFFNTWTINGNAQGFRGNFDGNGHTVYGMYYQNPNDWAAVMGLIPFASGNAVISNVNLKHSYIQASSYAGSLGGIVGVINKDGGKTASNVTVTKCVLDDTNDFSGLTNAFAGGIVGVVRESAATIKYCGSAVKFNSTTKPAGQGGGMVAKNSGWGMTGLSITNSYTVASFSLGIPDALYATFTDDYDPLYSCNNWPDGVVYVKSNKLMIGADALTTMEDLDWNVWQANNSAYPTIKGSTAYVKPVADGIDVWDGTTAVTYEGGTGTVTDPYLISTPEQLRKMILTPLTGESGKYYLLTNDIYLNDVSNYSDWFNSAPANNWRKNELFTKSFVGHIDGNGYAIYGLYHAEDNNAYWANLNRYAGLIANIGTGSSISNLHIRKSFVCSEYAGALIGSIGGTAGFASGSVTVSGCSADETVSVHGLYTGGLIGCAQAEMTVNNCYSSAALAGDSSKGGIYGNAWAGNANHTIKNSYSVGAYPVAMNSNNSGGKLPAEGKRVYENVYSLFGDYEQENWENIKSVSYYSEMTELDSNYWYGTETKRLINRGKATCDINGDGSETPDASDLIALRKVFLDSDSYIAVYDCNNDGKYDILDLIRLKKVSAGFFRLSSNTGYKLVFNDEFEGNSLDKSKWSFTDYMNGNSDLLTKTTADVAAVTTDSDNNGILRLTASKYMTGQYKASKSVTTGEHMTFKYGYLEIRAKVPTVRGVWPSFWLKSATTSDDALAEKLGYNANSVYETEVDVFETFGPRAEAVPNLHKWWKTQEQKELYGGDRVSSGAKATYIITDTDWHTYGMLWTPDEISMFVDGNCYMSYNLNKNFSNAESADVGMEDFQNPLCIIFNNHLFTPAYTAASGGAWASDYTVGDDFTSAAFEIDYVRLYQKPNESEIYFAN